ncbi:MULTISPECIES: carbamoyl-phosphate synthase large subunit [Pseudobutyrivibrio]|jgi:carbamoyl-phosphate synthase large subunit|uniref:Carbamoyl phosphate synthase large chain n=2 Tax=Pseudobutyrivibrio TaxID=46205 RepID=A0A2G3E8D4_9FIRM|nr:MULTISPECIES: carbamoyl-phosphate synthase large subunit [Pseudobutyrivibrio]MBE5904218.1 carbamoyl-phosphate synthase large subunit [Pseudobutyrivibrio sp.]MBP5326127.1 carbamoyl-phosphate synthase large subunit [Pseudobutyrivibrio sp.]MBP5594554.1 carbamoyl-phosphate synthase large subunit [Pseudobutyrivibrio sp.]MBR5649494.1 carbamoyl-phosphate synthase large subunit [Pseudobutyrivibrio sp.]NEX01553.1 carbamoyl-phosphate synthase large subunit [Pseudobutyrivibrio xylanivorans]
MPKRSDIKKVMVIGSGPIVIGQAAEFDYAGTQACRSLKEEGMEVCLVNSNPATIMTDKEIADQVYIEPLTVDVLKQIIIKEKPDSLLPTLGGQAGLNLGMELAESGFLAEQGVKLIGTTAETIFRAEDRQAFKDTMEKLGEPVAASLVVNTVEDGIKFTNTIGYPVVLRPAYTLGGSGGGIAHNQAELVEILTNGLRLSRVHEVLVERCIAGWKEIEYEVMRDAAGNCITVCNMENIDPVGVHTGDSIVVAPSQTLGDKEYQMLRTSALRIIDELGITGGCNVQYALHPESFEYCVIEVNPRVSRSSALASKATGYPIAKVAAKIALGYTLDEIPNAITKKTFASFEPMLDYCVVKIPRLPFDKFITATRKLTTQMKATGEVMSICNNFEGALMKAIRSLEQHVDSLMSYDFCDMTDEELNEALTVVDDRRIYCIAEALRRGVSYEKIHDITQIDIWFIDKIKILVEMEQRLANEELTVELLKEAKRIEFPDNVIADLNGKMTEEEVRKMRYDNGIVAAYKMVDTCAAEFDAMTPYYYSVYGSENEAAETSGRKKVLVLGSGPIRIGQGVEFDYCSVHATWAFAKEGWETVIVNNNPETVSTDFDIADKLYFEPLTNEDVESIVNLEKPDGAIVQFGGQTAIKLTEHLMKIGVPILGTKAEDVDAAEDRELFDEILEKTQIPRAAGGTVFTAEEAKEVANRLGYPVLVRPSYVLGGQGMQIAFNDEEIEKFMDIINQIAQDHPILVDKYLQGKEIEVDAICDGENILIPGIMEHIERTGIHSGDSISVYPAHTITQDIKDKIVDYTERLAKALHVLGMINIQFIAMDGEVYVIEVNPRSSRTVPYISKVTGIPIVDLAAKAILGHKITDMGYKPGLQPEADYIAIKMPVFSFEKLRGAEISLGPEMKSTGECLGIAKTFEEALYKAFLGAGVVLPKHKQMIITVKDADKPEALEVAKRFEKLGYKIYATRSTAKFLQDGGVDALRVNKITQESPNVMDLILGHKIDLVIDTPTQGHGDKTRDGFLIRRNAIETGINCITAMDTAVALATSLESATTEYTLVDVATI